MNNFLSKSDFQLASTCSKKLVYKKLNYPTTNDSNEYMELLAQGGYIIGTMAKLYFENGIEIDGSTEICLQKTVDELLKENVILFEPAIQVGQKITRVDILIKEGNSIHLIEVKAKSFDSTDSNSKKSLKKYIEDVAFQYSILTERFPDYEIRCSLMLPDKSVRTTIDGLASWFKIEEAIISNFTENETSEEKNNFNKPNVIFKYENHPLKSNFVRDLKDNGFLKLLDVTSDVKVLMPNIIKKSEILVSILNNGIKKTDYEINKDCKFCEFKIKDSYKNGFKECWENLNEPTHHIFDLYFGGKIKGKTKPYYLDELISQGNISLEDIDRNYIINSKEEIGNIGKRQLIQLENTKISKEWISEELNDEMELFEYPLHFIDFETYTGAIPFHKNMRPYDLIAFQWSCHTINSKGDSPIHKEWIHTGEMFTDSSEFPNFEFALALMNHISFSGTNFMWASHENTVLKTILEQMEVFNYKNDELKKWLLNITSDNKMKREGRLVDMNKMALKYYFHPDMKGKTSIKKVLPAIWTNFPYLHEIPFFKEYAPENFTTDLIDPYDSLKARNKENDLDANEVVSGGTDAMRAYYRIRFDDTISVTDKNEIRQQLLEYCKLDTMAMVIIGHHWGIK